MNNHGYPRQSWFDPRLENRPSPINGTGIFASAPIRAGERLQIVGGMVFTTAERDAGVIQLDPTKQYNEGQLDDDLWIVMPIDEDMNYFFNHSCNPNVWGDVARRDIAADEEITLDYALEIADDGYVLAPCRCGTGLCRGTITGDDWKLPELQERYRGHWMPFLQRRVDSMSNDE